jgi:glycerophosphoryl diester phosphodiesterase
MIEFDIQATKDSFLVIMHDETVDRTTNGKGKVSELTLAEIRQLDAGIKKDPSFSGTQVPTLEETLALMPRNVWLNCHVKGGAYAGKATAEAILKAERIHQSFITGGEAAAEAARQVTPRIQICNAESRYRKNTPQYVSATIRQKAGFIQLLRDGDNRNDLLAMLKKNRVKINYYYAKSPEELSTLLNAGVDFVLVNALSDFMSEAKKLGIQPVQPLF